MEKLMEKNDIKSNAGSRKGLRKKSLIKLFLFISAIGVLIFLVNFTGAVEYLDKEKLEAWIEGFGSFGPLIYIAIYAISPSLFLPGAPLTVAGGVVFGPFYGTLYTIVGATIGASVAFLIARYFARSQIEQLISGRLKDLDDGVERRGWVFVAITRLVPLFPFNVLNYAFGLTKIRFTHYVLASFIFMLPGTAAYVVLSSSLIDLLKGNISTEFILGAGLVMIVSLLPLLYKKNKKSLS